MAFLITSPATDRFIGALCNTLAHSLWLGLILAAVTGLIVLLTRKSSAARRYNLLIAALMLFAIGAAVTFAIQLAQAQPLDTYTSTIVGNSVANTVALHINITHPAQSLKDSLFGYLNLHHNTIVMVWFLIICAKSIQLVIGLLGVRRLKYTQVSQVTAAWYNRLQELANNLEIEKKIALLESGLAKVPMAIGAFKPVILIPIGLLTALSSEEVEAILIHELAHIKRRDYLVNLLQSLMEIIFFFNPAVLWLSQLIKAERENCCDDMALSQSNNKVSYIRALVSCEEYQASVPAYAMAFSGNKNNLINRVKRMVSNRNHTLNLFEKTVLAICLVISGLCLSAFTKKAQKEYIADTVAKVMSNIQRQSTGEMKKQYTNVELKNTNSGAQLEKQTPAIRSTDETLHDGGAPDSSKTHIQMKLDLDSMYVHLAAMKINPKVRLDSMKMHMAAIKVDTKVRLDSMKMHMAPIKFNLNNMRVNPKRNAEPNADPTVDTPHKVQYNMESNLKYAPNNATYNFHSNLKYLPNATVYGTPRYSNVSFMAPDTTKRKKINNVEKKFDLGDALHDAHLIKDKKNYKVVLNNKEMTVNGVKQPEDVHQTFLKYYIKKQGDRVDLTIGVTNSN